MKRPIKLQRSNGWIAWTHVRWIEGRMVASLLLALGAAWCAATAEAREPDRWLTVWPDAVPGETSRNPGVILPRNPNENPPATRIEAITLPRLAMFAPPADAASGAAAIVFPGGGYNYVVADKEGSEAAEWLNRLGITAFVLHYRTKEPRANEPRTNPSESASKIDATAPIWQRPVADGHQAVGRVRAISSQYKLDPNRIGVVGFSAGGQAAALVASRLPDASEPTAAEPEGGAKPDSAPLRPNFAVLVYPWQLVSEGVQLKPEFTVDRSTPPTILIHAHDDSSTSLSSIAFYTQLKRSNVPAELHIFENGGHGYGMRPSAASAVAGWTKTVERWLTRRGLTVSAVAD